MQDTDEKVTKIRQFYVKQFNGFGSFLEFPRHSDDESLVSAKNVTLRDKMSLRIQEKNSKFL